MLLHPFGIATKSIFGLSLNNFSLRPEARERSNGEIMTSRRPVPSGLI